MPCICQNLYRAALYDFRSPRSTKAGRSLYALFLISAKSFASGYQFCGCKTLVCEQKHCLDYLLHHVFPQIFVPYQNHFGQPRHLYRHFCQADRRIVRAGVVMTLAHATPNMANGFMAFIRDLVKLDIGYLLEAPCLASTTSVLVVKIILK